MTTKDRLAKALREARAPECMVSDALKGRYDDFESPSATPMVLLLQHAQQHGLKDIERRVMAGEFDATTEEAEAWASRQVNLTGDDSA
jgi:hypothetical protein